MTAFSANTNWEIRSAGNANNGGGFVSGASGTDYSQQNSAQYALTGLTSSGSGDTILSAAAATNMVGNVAQAISGTNINAGFYVVVSVVAGVSITFSTNYNGVSICSGAAASGVINIGGALTLLSTAVANGVSGNYFWIPKGNTIVEGSQITFDHTTQYTGAGYIYICGYDTAHGDTPLGSNRPVIQTSAAITLFQSDNYVFVLLKNLTLDGNNTGTYGFYYYAWAYYYAQIFNCEFKRFTSHGIYTTSPIYGRLVDCHDNGGDGMGWYGGYGYMWDCSFYNNAGNGVGRMLGRFINCVSINNGGYGFGAYGNGGGIDVEYINCTAAGNASDGFNCSGGSVQYEAMNCLSAGNGGYGYGGSPHAVIGCFYGGNTSGGIQDTTYAKIIYNNTNIGSTSPFVNLASNDVRLHATNGSSVKGAGMPGSLVGGATTGYIDGGAVQHQDSGGSLSRGGVLTGGGL